MPLPFLHTMVQSRHGVVQSEGEVKTRPLIKAILRFYSTQYAFAALKADGSITAWGGSNDGGTDAPSGKGYTKIYSTWRSFAALKADGSITAWGYTDAGGTDAPNAPTDKGYIKIYSMDLPLPPLEPMAQSRRGVTQILEVSTHPLTKAIPRFIQTHMPLPPLKPMGQSRHG
ncbi:hypothetical protein BSPWISOXPB_6334 [uncultured Gammaproteobacteria bacterium]|nr:hypothetical protein BSPWISOXPB_6334 [uncultured Gammaproteobacteria bacterium]